MYWELGGGQPFPAWTGAFALLAGLALGSFAGMLAYRLPRGLALDKPDSFCPSCRHSIGWRRNIPLLSFVFLRGRCAQCGSRIHWRYPVSEACCGLLALASWYVFGAGLEAIAVLLACVALVTLALIDLEHGLLPDRLTLGLLWLGLAFSLVPKSTETGVWTMPHFPAPGQAIAGAIMGYAVLWAFNVLWQRLRKRSGLGGGDCKLLAALGAWVGLQGLPLVVAPAATAGALTGLIMIALGRASFQTEFPFGPLLAAAGVLTLFLGPQLATMLSIGGNLAWIGL